MKNPSDIINELMSSLFSKGVFIAGKVESMTKEEAKKKYAFRMYSYINHNKTEDQSPDKFMGFLIKKDEEDEETILFPEKLKMDSGEIPHQYGEDIPLLTYLIGFYGIKETYNKQEINTAINLFFTKVFIENIKKQGNEKISINETQDRQQR